MTCIVRQIDGARKRQQDLETRISHYTHSPSAEAMTARASWEEILISPHAQELEGLHTRLDETVLEPESLHIALLEAVEAFLVMQAQANQYIGAAFVQAGLMQDLDLQPDWPSHSSTHTEQDAANGEDRSTHDTQQDRILVHDATAASFETVSSTLVSSPRVLQRGPART